MNKLTLGLSAIMMLAFVLMMAPGVLARNRGNILRNIAIWLAIVVVLGLAYQYLGPGRNVKLAPSLLSSPREETPSAIAQPETPQK